MDHSSVESNKEAVFSTFEEVAACLHGDQQQANEKLGLMIQNGGRSSVEEILVKKLKEEILHISFVRKVMTELTGKESKHDWSKDYYFMAVTSLGFGLNCKALVLDLLENVVERHYKLEDHHPEHMDYSKTMMNEEQILDMAVDRISRNLQFNNGEVNLPQMLKFEPRIRKCPVNDCDVNTPPGVKCLHEEELLRKYWICVHQNVSKVKSLWEKNLCESAEEK